MAEKTIKTAYTAEQTAELLAAYNAAADEDSRADVVQAFAAKFGKTVKSIVAKLSREGAYKKREYVSKTGKAPVSKETLADELGMLLNMPEGDVSSLTKANKTALVTLLDFVKRHALSKAAVI